jgi:hypothetical protein
MKSNELDVRKVEALERIAKVLETLNANLGTMVQSSPFGQNYLRIYQENTGEK